MRATSRSEATGSAILERVQVSDQGPDTDWAPALAGDVRAVVHLAARVHAMRDGHDPNHAQMANKHTNLFGTMRLARQAALSGVEHFVFMSTVKVSGETSPVGRPLRESDHTNPSGPYAESKYEAEQGLQALSQQTGMRVTVIRPPLVYGPNVRGNFGALMRCVSAGVPVPFASIDNRRSFIYVENLTDFVATCLSSTEESSQTFFVSDRDDVSTSELLKRVAVAYDRPSLLFPVRQHHLRLLAAAARKTASMNRLLDTLQLDISKAQGIGWKPPFTMTEGLRASASPRM